MKPSFLLSSFVTLVLGAYATPAAASGSPAQTSLSVLQQSQEIPEDFHEHIFDVPLAARLQLDGMYLGDAMLLLSAAGRVQLLKFTETAMSKIGEDERQRFAPLLEQGVDLGGCESDACKQQGLLEVHFSLENSQLSLISNSASARAGGAQDPELYTVPEHGSGLILSNNLALANNSTGTSGNYWLSAVGSVGAWSISASSQVDRSSQARAQTHHALQDLYAQREFSRNYLRLGYFQADSNGVFRQVNTPGVRSASMLGFMAGSSDSLRIDNGTASTFPIYVTANRAAIVEVYRDANLIYSQQVATGLQPIDTRSFPGGIYAVELRVIEDGVIVSRQEELIYKPTNWTDPSRRWRYNVYAGRRDDVWNSRAQQSTAPRDDERTILGANLNYLLHPRLVVGLAARKNGSDQAYGTSLDWELVERMRLYSSVYHSVNYGLGVDSNLLWSKNSSSLQLGYRDNWLNADETSARRLVRSRALSFGANHNFSARTSMNLRLAREQNVLSTLPNQPNLPAQALSGNSVDMTLRHRLSFNAHDARVDLRLFDRPTLIRGASERNRGVEIGLNMSLGRDRRADHSLSATLGTRTAAYGGRDKYASLAYQQRFNDQVLETVGLTATGDRYGLGATADAQFRHRLLSGSTYAQHSSTQGGVSSGLNLQSTVLLGGDRLAAGGGAFMSDAGMIVDVDAGLTPDVVLNAQGSDGRLTRMWAGRNVLPLSPYKPGKVEFEFAGEKDHNAVITTPVARYHLNKGGVTHFDVKVIKTFTVLGRLLDAEGQPLKGAQVLNHAGRTFTEPDGFFSLELSRQTPTLEISQGNDRLCTLSIDQGRSQTEEQLLMVGDLKCAAATIADATSDATETRL